MFIFLVEMENFWKTFCNETQLTIFNEYAFSNNRSIYYFDDCFQQIFVTTPIYILSLVLCAFYIGYYSTTNITQRSFSLNFNWIIFTRYITLFVLICVIGIFQFGNLYKNLAENLVAILKFFTLLIYFVFITRYTLVSNFDKQFKLLKALVFLFYLISLSECLTCFFTVFNQTSFILSTISSSLWFIHVFVLFKSSHQIVPQLLINENELHEEHEYSVLLDESKNSYVSRILFTWVTPLFQRGVESKIHSHDDLFQLPYFLSSTSVEDFVDNYLNTFPKKYSLICYLYKQIAKNLISVGILKLLGDVLSFQSPIFLNKLLLYLESDDPSYRGFIYSTCLFASTLGNALIVSYFNFQMIKISLNIRTILITLIYHKLFRVKYCTLINQFSTGEVLNLANTDIERVINFIPSVFQMVSLPIQLIVTLYLLYNEVGLVFLSGVAFILCLIPINKVICNKIGTLSKEMMKHKDSRIKLMSQILKGIRTIKMHYWQDSFIAKVQRFRSDEVKYLKWRKYLDALCVYFWATTPVIMSSLVFGTYAYVYGTSSLTSSKVFTSLALLAMLIMPLNALPWVLNGLVEALVSVRRLVKFFDLIESQTNDFYELINDNSDVIMELKQFSFGYSNDNSNCENGFKLVNIDVMFTKNSFTGIIGNYASYHLTC